ncbi:MAG: hypothetical protein KBB71_09845 [Lentimicrobiaceae bacterium]|nr:hypothetical protein [Lentimicrobiaceae bacterium]
MRLILPIIFFLTLINSSYSQILDNSLFRIYRASFIHGTVTHLNINIDSSYEMTIAEFHCSLCDYEELRNMINSKGIWTQSNDTIYLKSENRKKICLRIINDSLLRPILPIGYDFDSKPDSIKVKFIEDMQHNEFQDFHLIYDTYPNGVARLIIDRYRMKRNEYEMEFNSNGTLKKLDYYWDDKKSKRIR